MIFSNLIIVQGRADRMGVKMSHKYVFGVAKSLVVFFLFGSLLTGCDLLTNAKFMEKFARGGSPVKDSASISEQGLGKLAKDELLQAQLLFDRALQINPRDVHALLGKGIISQKMGQLSQAEKAFQAVISLGPLSSQKLGVLNNLEVRPIAELANMNLALLKNHGLSSSLKPGSEQSPSEPKGWTRSNLNTSKPGNNSSTMDIKLNMVLPDDRNVLQRFETLKKLRDQGLMTPQEYDVRRKANLGALLYLTQPPPAAGLNRTVPSSDLIIQRLKAIGKALELRAITVRQHGAERNTIVNALMPADPRTRSNPRAAPKGLLASADAIRRIEMLQEKGLVSSAEASIEKEAIEKKLRVANVPQPRKASPPGQKVEAIKKPSGPKPAVHIASFRSKKAADRGWAQLKRAHRALIGKLNPEITKVNLGGNKGVFYRLVVGPLASNADADAICRKLKRRRQYCEPAFMASN
ncbi:MAG: hypothetical protein CFH08_02360 [Alphaproteobacteria bacterium MarineAlpha3_Bin7]|nr:MAG: hypothetical protein CFH08_02360 [Alphaproteobacteria bacterium MarineAlpha3_Bin7]